MLWIIVGLLVHYLYDLILQLILQQAPLFLRLPQLLANFAKLALRYVRQLKLVVYNLFRGVDVLVRIEQVGYKVSVLLLQLLHLSGELHLN